MSACATRPATLAVVELRRRPRVHEGPNCQHYDQAQSHHAAHPVSSLVLTRCSAASDAWFPQNPGSIIYRAPSVPTRGLELPRCCWTASWTLTRYDRRMLSTVRREASFFGDDLEAHARRAYGIAREPRPYLHEVGLAGQDQRAHAVGTCVRRSNHRVLSTWPVNEAAL